MLSGRIEDGWGKGVKACVSTRGQLVTAPLEFSTFYNVKAEAAATGYNLVPPKTGKRFVITDIMLYANKNVGAADATVDLYEASSTTSTTVDTSILNTEMLKQTTLALTGLNINWLGYKIR